MNYQKGQKLRAHDFPGEDLKSYYIEGEISEVDQEFIHLECTFDNTSAKNRVGQSFLVPIKDLNDSIWGYPRLEIIPNC
jgi:hypothetical protein